MDAFLYAEGAPDESENHPPLPYDLAIIGYIDRFGVKAVLGRDVLAYREIQRMLTSEHVYTAYISRQMSKNWEKWAKDNPKADELLKNVEMLIHDGTD